MTAPVNRPLATGRLFRLVLAACVASFLADGLLTGYLPLFAAQGTNDTRLVSLVSAVFSFGALATGLIAGAVADRRSRLALMRQSNTMRLAVLVVLGVLLLSGTGGFAALLLASALLGGLEPYFDAASSAVIPEVVRPDSYERANVLMQVAMLVAGSLLGPSLGGVLYGATLPGLPVWLTAATFGVSALIILRAERGPLPTTPAHGTGTGVMEDLVSGITYLWRDRPLRTLAACAAVVNGMVAAVMALLVLFVTQDLALPASRYGFVVACVALGGAVGSGAAPSLGRRHPPYVLVMASMGLLAVCGVVLGIVVRPVATCVTLAGAGVAVICWNVVVVTYRQRTVPLDMLGRVTSAYRVTGKAAMVIGSLAAGQLAGVIGIPATFVVGGSVIVVTIALSAKGLRGMGVASSGETPDADGEYHLSEQEDVR